MNTATQTVYTPVNIIPCDNGFGEWQLGQIEISPEHSYGLLSQLEREGELVALEDALQNPDFKEAGIKDIRGLIHNQPPLIYARLNECSDGQVFINRVSYIGVVESEAPLDFYGKPNHNQQGEQAHQQIEAIFKAT